MKKLFCLAVFVLVLSSSVLAADTSVKDPGAYGPEGKRVGLGLYLGEPTGFTGKGYFTEQVALDVIAAWSFVDDSFTLVGDVTYDFFDLPVDTDVVGIPFYVGVGGKFDFDRGGKNKNQERAGIRIPVGLAFQWNRYPIEAGFEVAPGMQFVPKTDFDISGGIFGRFYF